MPAHRRTPTRVAQSVVQQFPIDVPRVGATFPHGIVQVSFQDADSITGWIPVAKRYSMAVDVQVRSTFTWSTGVIGMEWSISDQDYANSVTFSPVVSFTATTKSRYNIDIAGMVWVRFRVTTAEGANDPAAKIIYMIE